MNLLEMISVRNLTLQSRCVGKAVEYDAKHKAYGSYDRMSKVSVVGG